MTDGVPDILVVCIGNTLRGDDGAGSAVGDLLEECAIPGLTVVRVFQLLPELAVDIARHDACILVDAAAGALDGVTFAPVITAPDASPSLHAFTVDGVVSMARTLFGATTPVYLCTVPAFRFEHGEGLSESTRGFVRDAAERIEGEVRGLSGERPEE